MIKDNIQQWANYRPTIFCGFGSKKDTTRKVKTFTVSFTPQTNSKIKKKIVNEQSLKFFILNTQTMAMETFSSFIVKKKERNIKWQQKTSDAIKTGRKVLFDFGNPEKKWASTKKTFQFLHKSFFIQIFPASFFC